MKLSDIAKLAGVSVSTVSKVMAGSGEISDKTKETVIKIAKDNGVFEKYYHGTYEKKVVAVILPEIKSEHYANIATTIRELVENSGAMTIFAETNFEDEKYARFIEYFAFRGMADGIITVGGKRINADADIPVVMICGNGNGKIDTVSIDFKKAIETTVKYLKDCGHRKIAYIGERLTASKCQHTRDALEQNFLDVNEEHMITSNKRFENAGIDGVKQLFKTSEMPTAIIAAYDYIAMGAIKALKEAGRSVPEDISVIGMDNIAAAAYPDISLTTIGIDYKALCEIAVDLIMKKIKNKYFRIRQDILVEAELEIRDSVKHI